MNFWRRATIYSPILCRLLARVPKGRPLTDEEVAARSNLPRGQVWAIMHSPTWDGIDLPTMQKYLVGCGLDFCNRNQMNRVDEYRREQARLNNLGRSTWRYLKRSPDWTEKYRPMFIAYIKHLR